MTSDTMTAFQIIAGVFVVVAIVVVIDLVDMWRGGK